jgi:hypothetical protein
MNHIITASNGDVFRIESQIDNPEIYNVLQEYPHPELLGLMYWNESLHLYTIFQVGVVRLPLPQPITKLNDAPYVLRGLLAVVPQPTCSDCVHYDKLRGCCRTRRDRFVSWTDCLLPVSAGDRACSRFAELPVNSVLGMKTLPGISKRLGLQP